MDSILNELANLTGKQTNELMDEVNSKMKQKKINELKKALEKEINKPKDTTQEKKPKLPKKEKKVKIVLEPLNITQ